VASRQREIIMTMLTLGLSSRADTARRFAAAMSGEDHGHLISFASPELIWKVLTAKRWDIIKRMTGAGDMSIREVARRVGRDVKAVHGDVTALVAAGLLERAGKGVVFPYDAVRVEFELGRAA
jgi:predicted transcriptional regulator